MEEVKHNYLFKVLWAKNSIGIAINEFRHLNSITTPLTTFYFWPREDGWKLLKDDLDNKPWMNTKTKLEILNTYTLIINYWLRNINQNQEKGKQKKEVLDFNLEILAKNFLN